MAFVQVPSPEKIGILLNPLAGSNQKICDRLIEALSKVGRIKQVTTPSEVESALWELANSGKSWLIVSGGDGTVKMVLTTLFSKGPYPFLPYLCLLPGGTTNLNSHDVGIKKGQIEAVKRLRTLQKKGFGKNICLRKRNIIKVSNHQAFDYGMFLGGGLVAQGVSFFKKRYGKSRKGTTNGLVLTILKFVWSFWRASFSPQRIKLDIDGNRSLDGLVSVFLVSSLESFWGGLQPFWAKGPGALKMSVFFNRPKRLVFLLPYVLFGRFHPAMNLENGYFSCRFFQATLKTDEELALDGELIESKDQPFVIENAGEVIFWTW